LQWQKCIGAINIDYSYFIATTFDKGYIVAGSSLTVDDNSQTVNGENYWITKLGTDVLLPVTALTLTGKTEGKENLLQWTTVIRTKTIPVLKYSAVPMEIISTKSALLIQKQLMATAILN
jgi:hypothetical protein